MDSKKQRELEKKLGELGCLYGKRGKAEAGDMESFDREEQLLERLRVRREIIEMVDRWICPTAA